MADHPIPPAPISAEEAAAQWRRKMIEAGADPDAVVKRRR